MSRASPIEWTLDTRHLGRRALVYPQLDSTNSLALSLGNEPANHGLVVLAHEQTAGRGQYGRTWQAPAGSSVLMTVLLFPPPPLRRPAVLTAWAAVAVSEVILQITGLEAKIKWPNDVYLEGKKVCGILIEQRNGGAELTLATAVGIGLNVRQPASFFEQAGLTLGGSLLSVAGREFDHDVVARQLIRRLDDDYARLADGDFGTLEAIWKQRLQLLGREVTVETGTARHHGRLRAVTFDAVELEAGQLQPLRLTPEAVRQIVPCDD
jgi:BirA family transcriptional regulator, biotin operon repressor / biotin---[acetyl-CoA-carboxylase] ligase